MIRGTGTRVAVLLALAFAVVDSGPQPPSARDQLWRHRNLGKAYFENPMTQMKAVDEFRLALTLAPNSTRDRVNYGLALLRAGKVDEAIPELVKAQKEDPSIPHTWFNLAVAYKKQFQHPKAIEQFEGMLKLVPDDAVSHYNLGIELKLTGRADAALKEFESAARLNPNFAAPHFQLYNAYREADRKEDAARELELFNEIKKRKASAAVQEDPEWNYYAEIYDVAEPDQDFDQGASAPTLKFQPVSVASGVDAATAGMTVLDFDGDGNPDLLVWSDNGIVLLRSGSVPVAHSGLEKLKGVLSVAPADFNNDGLPDLAVVTRTGASLFVNRNGKFELSAIKMPQGNFTKALWVDYDHDYDLDLLLLGGTTALLRNDGAAGFSDQTANFPFVAGYIKDATVFDLVPDNNETDIATLGDDGALVIYHDRLLGRYEPEKTGRHIAGGLALQARDINNDGWTDLIAMTSDGPRLLINNHGKLTDGPEGLKTKGTLALADLTNRSLADIVVNDSIYRNLGEGKFEAAKVESLPGSFALSAADFDGDGLVDLAVVTCAGSVQLLKNKTTVGNRSASVKIEGVKNLKLPVDAVVEVKAGAWYQKQTYEGVPLIFGLRDYSEVDTVRITWPNGMVQNETKQPIGQQLSYKEKPRLSGSCPMIFAWNGSSFEFITDILGVAPLGAGSGDGGYFPVNNREHIQIPGSALRLRDGHYEIRVTEELREVSYLDQIQLIAVDHDASQEIFTNDKFKSPPFPEFRLFGVRQRLYPRRALDQEGRDVRQRLIKRDGSYVDSFPRNPSGVADLHSLVLDFGNVASDNKAALVLNGWVDWADGSTFVAASQESKEGLIFPYLQVKDAEGNWKTVVADMGIPSGKPKNMVVDLAGKFLSASREVRIVTNLCVYWDEIFLAENSGAPRVKMTGLTPDEADLRYRGFSQVTIHPERTRPERFDYEKWTPTTGWNPTPGFYTRYGEVRELLTSADDRMVIMGSGDELRLRFVTGNLPALPAGWKRDFLLMVDGWAKDGDSNTAFARTVTPLPFHGMAAYPYPPSQHFPADRSHRLYLDRFNSRSAIPDISRIRP
jgi:Flp pilus assembly protein TadD